MPLAVSFGLDDPPFLSGNGHGKGPQRAPTTDLRNHTERRTATIFVCGSPWIPLSLEYIPEELYLLQNYLQISFRERFGSSRRRRLCGERFYLEAVVLCVCACLGPSPVFTGIASLLLSVLEGINYFRHVLLLSSRCECPVLSMVSIWLPSRDSSRSLDILPTRSPLV